MPIYEYRCSACGHELEALQKLSDAPLTDCPTCGKSELRKRVSAAGFQLKGSGWYVTDFRNNGAGKDKAAKGAAKPNGGADTSGEGAKPESKSTETATTSTATESKTSTAPASKSET